MLLNAYNERTTKSIIIITTFKQQVKLSALPGLTLQGTWVREYNIHLGTLCTSVAPS